MKSQLLLSKCEGTCRDTNLKSWTPTQNSLAKDLNTPTIGDKDGSYYLRCAGTQRNNEDTVDVAPILLLDGDSRINEDGEIIPGAPDPELVHIALASQEINHVIYSSYSNGEHGDDYYKYRVIIFIEHNRKQLPILLDHFHELLHKEGVLLFNVKENRTWAQPWYFPRTTPERKHLFKFYEYLDVHILAQPEHPF